VAEEKSPRDLDRSPDAIEEQEGIEAVAGHGVRTTARTDVVDPETGINEAQQAAYERAISEDFEHGRSTGAGPNPYKLQSVQEKHGVEGDVLAEAVEYFGGYHMGDASQTVAQYLTMKESQAESGADDAEVPVLGGFAEDHSQKIQLNPDRVAADEKAVLPNVRERHGDLIKEIVEGDDNSTTSDAQVAAYGEAQGELDEPQYLGPPHPEDRRAGEEYNTATDGSEDSESNEDSENSESTEDSEAKK
jgi:hypothetical protein